MKQSIPLLFLLFTMATFAKESTISHSEYAAPGPAPQRLNIAERLWLLCRAFSFGRLSFPDTCNGDKSGRQSVSYFKRDSFIRSNADYSVSELSEMMLKDFVLYDSAGIEYLSLQKRADIMSAAIGWPGLVSVDTITHFVWFDFTVPQREYSRKRMRELSQRYAALTYSWLLRKENIKRWTMQVHFSKQKGKRLIHLANRVYAYVGEVYFHSLPDPTFDEVLAQQLRDCACF